MCVRDDDGVNFFGSNTEVPQSNVLSARYKDERGKRRSCFLRHYNIKDLLSANEKPTYVERDTVAYDEEQLRSLPLTLRMNWSSATSCTRVSVNKK
jgi:hypothetical protein